MGPGTAGNDPTLRQVGPHGLSLPGAGKQDAGTLRPCFHPLHPVLWLQSTEYSNMV